MKNDRQVVVGQLARIPKNGPPSMEVLLRIDNFIQNPKSGEKERKIQVCDFFLKEPVGFCHLGLAEW